MSRDRLADTDARTAVTSELGRTLVVEAGAGSGKTTTIIERIVEHVRNGTDISSVVAVTFTEAAAAELRTRLRINLEEDVAEGGPHAERARRALVGLDDASIGTLHSWARRIIAEFPLELGLPPRIDVLDEVQTSIERSRSWRALFTDLLADPELSQSVALLESTTYRVARLREVYEELSNNVDRLLTAGTSGGAAIQSIRVDTAGVLESIARALSHRDACTDDSDALLCTLDDWAHAAEALRQADDDLDAFTHLAAAWPPYRNKGRKQHWPEPSDKATVLGALDEAAAALEAERHRVLDAAVANVTGRILDRVLAEADDRHRKGELQFADLLVLACRLLRTSRNARERNHRRSRVVIIDEFQDTDPLQAELAALVVTDAHDVGDVPWWELPIPPGSLVIVGDPKQSIYRFRRADLGVFARATDVHRTGHVRFTSNFRSRPAIVEWVDEVIGVELAEGAARDPSLQAEHVPLDANRADPSECPVQLFGDAHPEGARIEDIRTAEAADIATILTEIRAGRHLIEDRDRTVRPARLGDTAILLPTRVVLPYLEHALAQADIPARIESETLALATQVVRDLLVILEAAVDPNDDVAVVGALRTPAFACRDDELALHALAGGSWNHLREPPPESPRAVATGIAQLRTLHGDLPAKGVVGAVEHVIRTCRFLELGLAERRPRDHWRRALHVADLARSFVETGGTNLREFVAWLRERAEAELRTVEVPVPEPDDDAVRILTVHGAKGLEFPITILAGLNAEDRVGGSAVLWDGGARPVLTAPPIRPAEYDDLFAAEKQASSAEAARVLYVAATRARDHLFVSLHRKDSSSDKTPAVRIATRCDAAPTSWRRWEPDPEPAQAVQVPPPEPFDLAAWSESHDRALQRGGTVAAVAATTLAGETPAESGDVGDDVPAHRRGRAGSAIGRAVHATLQSVDLATGDGIAATARAQAFAEGVPEHTATVEALATNALTAPIVSVALEGGRHWREVPVGADIDGVVVEGFIDLLVETSDGLVVVDWKTDRVSGPAEARRRMSRYRIQGAAYALALEAALGRPVVRCVFVFTGEDGVLELEVEDLPEALADARMRLREHADR